MATVNAHQSRTTRVEELLGRTVCYQKHKPGKHLSLERMPEGDFQIESVRQFGDCLIVNDGVIVMEGAPTVMLRRGRLALLLSTGEELYFHVR